jgi:hypothetical protein
VYTTKSLREDLWAWGEAVKHGYWRGHIPADPETPRLAAVFESRPPCDTTYLDICRAFAALHPATRGLGNAGDMAWWAHVPTVSRPQQVIWLFYVGDADTDAWGAVKFRRDWKAMGPEARTLLLELETQHPGRHVVLDDARGDDLIAARLRVSRRTVYYDRSDAISRMVRFLNPPQPSESAA